MQRKVATAAAAAVVVLLLCGPQLHTIRGEGKEYKSLGPFDELVSTTTH